MDDLDSRNWTKEKRTQTIYKELGIAENELLTDEERKMIMEEVIIPYHNCFSLSDKEIGLCRLYTHRIRLKDDSAVINVNRCIPMHQLKMVRDKIMELVELGILEESVSEHRSPVVLVNKRDGSKRFVVDFRKLNSMTIDDQVPLPSISEVRNIFGQHGQNKYFLVLDMSSAYHQIF